MSYVVLARRWRPKHFSELVGQEHVARTLSNAIAQDRVAHAFLFCGPRGVGKTSAARILAKALNCAEGPTATPCYACASCSEVGDGSAVDVIEIDGASNRGVGEIRELRENVRYAPSRDRLKIYIIDEVHMLTSEAFNALLKTLEEPPPHVKFIFATTEPRKIPVTILSRCQRFDFKRIPAPKITERLASIAVAEGIEVEEAALSMIARQADGGMRDALSLTDQVVSFCEGAITERHVADVLGLAGRDTLFRLSGAIVNRQVEGALRVLDEVNQGGYDLASFAGSLVNHLRDLAVVAVSEEPEALTDLGPNEVVTARAQVEAVGLHTVTRMFNIMVDAAETMARSSYPKLLFEMTLVKLAAVEPLVPLEPLLKRLEAMEAGVFVGEVPTPPASPAPAAPAAVEPSSAPPGTAPPPTSASAAQVPRTPNVAPAQVATLPAPEPSAPEPKKTEPTAAPQQTPTTAKSAVPQDKPPRPARRPGPEPSGPALDEPPPPTDSERPEFDTEAFLGTTAVVPKPTTAPPRATKAPATAAPTMKAAAEVAPIEPNSVRPPLGPPPVEKPQAPPPEPRLPPGDPLAAAEARKVWRAVVESLRVRRPIVAEMYQQAAISSVAPGRLELVFEEALSGIADRSDYLKAVAKASREVHKGLFDSIWQVQLSFIEHSALPTDELTRSLAFEHREAAEARRQAARHLIATHSVVAKAAAIFSPKSTHVVLDEDDL